MLRVLPVATILFAVIAVGLVPRFATYHHWNAYEEAFFHGEERLPLLSAADGYHFLDLARAWAEGTYEIFDPDKRVPYGLERPFPPPLFSVFLASLHQATGFPIEWIASLYSPLAGVIIAIPIYLLATLLARNAKFPWKKADRMEAGPHIMGIFAAAFALLSPAYVYRSSFAWGDTDPLNLLFVVCAILFAYGAAIAESGRGRLFHLGGWLITFTLFLWWWEVPVVVISITGLPLAVALGIILFRRPRAAPLIVLATGAGLVMATVFYGPSILQPERFFGTVSSTFGYLIAADAEPHFHAAGEFITELAAPSVSDLGHGIAGHPFLFVISAVGLVGLLIAVRLHALFLVPLLVLAGLSLTGMRFMLFAAPLFGLGMGFLALLAWHILHRSRSFAVAFVMLLAANVYLFVQLLEHNTSLMIPRTPSQIEGMTKLSEITPEGAVIWTHRWGHGHALKYHSRRGVISDGAFHPSYVNYVQAFPFTATSSRQAANWMQFYIAHGQVGLRRANTMFGEHDTDWATGMSALQHFHAIGPARALRDKRIARLSPAEQSELLAFLFPEQDRPIYVFLDDSWKRTHWFEIGAKPLTGGSWQYVEYNYLPLTNVFATDDRQWVVGSSPLGDVSMNAASGLLAIEGGQVGAVESLFIRQSSGELVHVPFSGNVGSGVFLNVNVSGRVGVLANDRLQRSLMTRLYYQEDDFQGFFTRIESLMPHYSVWRVEPEVWSRMGEVEKEQVQGS